MLQGVGKFRHTHLLYGLDEEKNGAKRRPHLVAHCRLKVLRVLVLLHLLLQFDCIDSRMNLLGDIAHENDGGTLT